MNIIIDQGTYADLDAVEPLYNDLHEKLEAGVNFPGWRKDIYPTREDAGAGISEENLFIARRGSRMVGSVILNHKQAEGYSGAGWQYDGEYNEVLVVHPAFAKSGIGVQLPFFAESLGHRNNMNAIRLDVYEKNTPAI